MYVYNNCFTYLKISHVGATDMQGSTACVPVLAMQLQILLVW